MATSTSSAGLARSRRFAAWERLASSLSTDTRLTLETKRALPGGAVEIVYAVSNDTGRAAS